MSMAALLSKIMVFEHEEVYEGWIEPVIMMHYVHKLLISTFSSSDLGEEQPQSTLETASYPFLPFSALD